MAKIMIRLDRKGGYTVLQTSALRDPRLSLKTKGLLAVMLSLPGSWSYNIRGLATICSVGKDAMQTGLKELEAAGYLTHSGNASGIIERSEVMAESMIRLDRKGGYTVLQTSALRDPRLSLKTKGLLAVMLSLPGSWSYNVRGLATICYVGKDAIQTGLKELEAAGYLTKGEQKRAEGGKFGGTIYTLHEKSTIPRPVEPCPVEPCPVEPYPENPPLVNKEIVNTPYSPPRGQSTRPKKRDRTTKDAPDWKPERFAGFWNYYPLGNAKQKAIAAWDKLKPSDDLISTMGHALQRQMATEQWQQGVGIPHASTWLNQRRWEDAGLKPIPRTQSGGPPQDRPGGWD